MKIAFISHSLQNHTKEFSSRFWFWELQKPFPQNICLSGKCSLNTFYASPAGGHGINTVGDLNVVNFFTGLPGYPIWNFCQWTDGILTPWHLTAFCFHTSVENMPVEWLGNLRASPWKSWKAECTLLFLRIRRARPWTHDLAYYFQGLSWHPIHCSLKWLSNTAFPQSRLPVE